MSLRLGDRVTFSFKGEEFTYSIEKDYLQDVHSSSNFRIFNLLLLDSKQKYQWAANVYGYSVSNGDWPYFQKGDFESVERFVNDIKRVLDLVEKSERYLTTELALSIISKKDVDCGYDDSDGEVGEDDFVWDSAELNEIVYFDTPFKRLKYSYKDTYLESRESYSNDKIFDALNLRDHEMRAWAALVYGYAPGGGIFPEYRTLKDGQKFVNQIKEILKIVKEKLSEGVSLEEIDVWSIIKKQNSKSKESKSSESKSISVNINQK